MKGYLKQITNADGEPLGLYHTNIDFDEGLLAKAYKEYDNSNDYFDMDFDDYWNARHSPEEQIERVFIDEVYIK